MGFSPILQWHKVSKHFKSVTPHPMVWKKGISVIIFICLQSSANLAYSIIHLRITIVYFCTRTVHIIISLFHRPTVNFFSMVGYLSSIPGDIIFKILSVDNAGTLGTFLYRKGGCRRHWTSVFVRTHSTRFFSQSFMYGSKLCVSFLLSF